VDNGIKDFFLSTGRDEPAVSVCAFTEVGANFAAKVDPSGRSLLEEIFEG
jgi:hypothetical protein